LGNNPSRFDPSLRIREILRAFPDLPLEIRDYETAASFFNKCRKKGIQGSNTDFLICAVASRHGMSIFTNDNDFQLYEKHLNIELFSL
jgi:predicted nucleic acid-binding protein